MKNLNRPFSFLGILSDDYEYKIFRQNDKIYIAGAHKDKEPILFLVQEDKIKQIEL